MQSTLSVKSLSVVGFHTESSGTIESPSSHKMIRTSHHIIRHDSAILLQAF